MNENIYVLMDKDGSVSFETYFLIRKTITSDSAKKYVARALSHAFSEIKEPKVYMMRYADVVCYCIPSWDWTARNMMFPNVKFVNQDIHDLDDAMKLKALTDFE